MTQGLQRIIWTVFFSAAIAYIVSSRAADRTSPREVIGNIPGTLPDGGAIRGDQMEVGNTHGGNVAVFGLLVPQGHRYGFPTAQSDYAIMSNPGDQAFGHYSAVYGTAAGLWTNEFTSFNYSGQDAPEDYPWSRAWGLKTSVGIPITCTMFGPHLNAACLEVGGRGQFGIVMQPGAARQAAIVIDANEKEGSRADLLLRHRGAGDAASIEMTTVGTGSAPILRHRDRGGQITLEINSDGSISGPIATRQHFHAPLQTPNSAKCEPGDFMSDANAIYVCTGPNRWRHAKLFD